MRRRGEDVAAGETVLRAGDVITPAHVMLMSACGVETVRVAPVVRIGVISTGSEVCDSTELAAAAAAAASHSAAATNSDSNGEAQHSNFLQPKAGHIHNAVAPYLLSRLSGSPDVTATYLGNCADDPSRLQALLMHSSSSRTGVSALDDGTTHTAALT